MNMVMAAAERAVFRNIIWGGLSLEVVVQSEHRQQCSVPQESRNSRIMSPMGQIQRVTTGVSVSVVVTCGSGAQLSWSQPSDTDDRAMRAPSTDWALQAKSTNLMRLSPSGKVMVSME